MNIANQSKRTTLILFSIITLVTLTFLYLSHYHHQVVLQTIVEEEQRIAGSIYENAFNNFNRQYESIAQQILINPDVINAIDTKNRKKLLALTMPIYKELLAHNPHLSIMHFHTAQTKSFLRLHKPEKYGDDLSDIRHMINTVNQTHKKKIGMEVGRYGINYRLAFPIKNKLGENLGVFEFGVNLDYVLEYFKKEFHFQTVLLLKKDIFKIIYEHNKHLNFKSISDKYSMLEQPTDLVSDYMNEEMINKKFALISFKSDENLLFPVAELTTANNQSIGKIYFIKKLNFYTDKISTIRTFSIVFAILLLLFSYYLLRKILMSFAKTVNHYQHTLEIKNRTLLKLTHIDHLTKINNRKYTETIISKELKRAKRYNQPLSIIMFDVDNFKSINDTYGHNIGDKVLRNIAKIVSSTIRESDYFGRWGGEEFIIVSTETSAENGKLLAEKIRSNIAKYDFKEVQHVTCSFGVAQYVDGQSNQIIVNHADIALYEAKNAGKNIVSVYNYDISETTSFPASGTPSKSEPQA